MFGNLCVGVKTVDNIEMLRKRGGHFGQVRGASAADYKNIDFIFEFFEFVGMINSYARGSDLNSCGISSREYADKFGIVVERNSRFNSSAEVAVTVNSYL